MQISMVSTGEYFTTSDGVKPCVGGKDSHLGPDVMPWIASRIPGAKVIMMNTRHFVHLEKPVAFNAAMQSFLNGIDTATH